MPRHDGGNSWAKHRCKESVQVRVHEGGRIRFSSLIPVKWRYISLRAMAWVFEFSISEISRNISLFILTKR